MNLKNILTVLALIIGLIKVNAQSAGVTITAVIISKADNIAMPFVNVSLLNSTDSSLLYGTITNEQGRFSFSDVKPGSYILKASYIGYDDKIMQADAGRLSLYLDIGKIIMNVKKDLLDDVIVTASKQNGISNKMDKKTFNVADNITQTGSSVLEAMKNLPGVTVGQDGKLQLRGSDKLIVLIDGKQTALTGFGNQASLDNIPASAIDKIEIINNPSAKYDAAGNADIVNIIYKKEKKQGFNGKVGLSTGLGALWIKKENLPGIRPQYRFTPKLNPSISLNYLKKNVNLFVQLDNLYSRTLNKNEFVDRYYTDDTVRQQTKRNRQTNTMTGKAGADWYVNANNTITASALFSSEKILDKGDEPFYNYSLTEKRRLWQFLEDELKTTVTFSASWQHKFRQPGRVLNVGFNQTYHRENEKYFFTNQLPSYTSLDSFKLLSDEHVADLTADYVQPLKYGYIEGGIKFRYRYIPVNMQFKPGIHSPLDVNAGGWANYSEVIPAVYSNYVYETNRFEVEAGIRVEYVNINYEVNPDHETYKSSGYDYTQPFPTLRLGYKFNNNNKISVFYNRRVDRPNEVDIRIFPKYDDAEIIKVGNPDLRPQFTNNFEAGYKTGWLNGSLYTALYHKSMNATITRIASTIPGNNIIYNIFQNTGKSYTSGVELVLTQKLSKALSVSANLNGYHNTINAFSVLNKYPVANIVTAQKQKQFSGNMKINSSLQLPKQLSMQLSAIYLAPDIIPQGKVYSRFSLDIGIKKSIQKNKGELFINATDIANTMQLKKKITGNGFELNGTDYYETQVVRVGYDYKF